MSLLQRACTYAVACTILWASIAVAQERTEAEIAELVVREGHAASAIRAQYEVVRREQLARLSLPNPVVSYSREGAGVAEFVEFEQALPIFGSRAALRRAGVAAAEAADAEREARLWLLRSRALEAASRVAAHQRSLDAAEETRSQIETLVARLRVREEEGEGSRFDRLRAQHELIEAQQIAVAVAAELAESRAALTAMLPTGAAVSRVIPRPAASPTNAADVGVLIARANTTRAELRALQHSGVRAEREAIAARRMRLPVAIVTGGLKRGDENGTRQTGGVFGLSGAVPLFDTGSRDAARWDAERTRVNAERSALQQEIAAQIRAATDILTARRALLPPDGQVPGAELATIAETAYREGEIGIFELLDAVRASARARARDVEIRLNVRLAEIALERAVGDVLWP